MTITLGVSFLLMGTSTPKHSLSTNSPDEVMSATYGLVTSLSCIELCRVLVLRPWLRDITPGKYLGSCPGR